jgi:hypothetical protein
MSHEPTTGRRLLVASEWFLGRAVAVVLGIVLMVSGLGMGVTMVLLPIGVPLGLVGLLLILWGVFYAHPEATPGGDQAHGHGAGPAGH